jgi:hypothetical protein
MNEASQQGSDFKIETLCGDEASGTCLGIIVKYPLYQKALEKR